MCRHSASFEAHDADEICVGGDGGDQVGAKKEDEKWTEVIQTLKEMSKRLHNMDEIQQQRSRRSGSIDDGASGSRARVVVM